MTDTMLRPPPRRPGARTCFWQVELSVAVDGSWSPSDAKAMAAAVGGYPDLRLEGVEHDPAAGTVAISLTLPAFDAVHAIERAAHFTRECGPAADHGLAMIVRATGGPGRAPRAV
jgi:hypothetical protein